ncbi:MAG: hypothetical protein IPM37_16445 [Hahellaceae bacterium]|nr:hypothetical protein [Hahellaceae bacterium]
MSSTSPASSADLHPLARNFNVWRKQRLARRSPVPADLRQRAVDLLPHYPQIRLSKALGVTPKMLKQWRDDRVGVEDSRCESPFIAVTLTAESVVSETLPVDLTLTLQEPNRVRIQGQLTLRQLTALMQGLGVSGEGLS